jgi:hypothetical protein
MGASFTNIHIYSTQAEEVGKTLAQAGATPAYIGSSSSRWTSVYPEKSETQDADILKEVAASLSKLNATWGLASLVHDSDIFQYWLFKDGIEVDSYDSAPGYWQDEELPPAGGNVNILSQLIGDDCDKSAIEHVLRDDEDEFLFAEDRCAGFAKCLGINERFSTVGFEYISSEGTDEFHQVD